MDKYQAVHLDTMENRTSWSSMAAYLRKVGLDGTVAWLLEALGPLTVLGAQALHFGEPFIRSGRPPAEFKELVNLLEDPGKSRDFAAFLREKG
jgi:flagellar biosynthesis/type III secretory pathway ATPase